MSNRLVRRQGCIQSPPAELRQKLLHHRHPRSPTRRQHRVNPRPAKTIVLQNPLHHLPTTLQQHSTRLLKLPTLHLPRLQTVLMTHRNRRPRTHRQTALRLLSLKRQKLQTFRGLARIHAELRYKTLGRQIDQHSSPVEPPQLQIPVRCNHLHLVLTVSHHSQIQSPPAKIKNQNLLRLREHREIQTVTAQHMTQRRRYRLVDHLHSLQTRSTTRLHRRLTLSITELSRHGDHRLRDLTQLLPSPLKELSQDQRRNLHR